MKKKIIEITNINNYSDKEIVEKFKANSITAGFFRSDDISAVKEFRKLCEVRNISVDSAINDITARIVSGVNNAASNSYIRKCNRFSA